MCKPYDSKGISHMEESRKKQLGGSLILLLTAFIWGSSFVAQSVGMAKRR